jgi:hypothetical protein
MQKHTFDAWRETFDKLHGAGAAAEFERLLVEQNTTFRAIGLRFGISTQRVSQLVERHFPAYNRRTVGTIQMRRAAAKRVSD